jgi:hypothetical protein
MQKAPVIQLDWLCSKLANTIRAACLVKQMQTNWRLMHQESYPGNYPSLKPETSSPRMVPRIKRRRGVEGG